MSMRTRISIKFKTLSFGGSEGKSSVVNRYRNGAEIKIEYKYPKEQEIFEFEEALGWDFSFLFGQLLNLLGYATIGECSFYYSRDIVYETAYYGTRGVYTLGNTYYVIDHLPQDSLPATISLANSWNMPKNTTQMGSTGWQRFVFEGTTPDSNTFLDPDNPALGKYTSRSRIELAVAGATNVESVFDSSSNYQMKKNQYLATNHITFENDLHGHQFLLTQIRSCDAAANLTLISNQTIDTTVFTGGIVWKREYSNGSIDVIAYNPEKQSQTLESILTSDAEVWLLHADATGSWRTARLYDATFVQYPSVTPTTVNSYDSPGMEVQYDFAF